MRPGTNVYLTVMALVFVASRAAVAGEVVQIKIGDLAFVPAFVTLNVGDTIEWINEDFVDHTATETEEKWDVVVAAGQHARLVAGTPGSFAYYCRYHPGMTAQVRVAKP